ncbi:hypothetical protein RRG08_003611 [Elysia crispata]|uniref:Uncharacterized protein n=1 Tax=Elysia crispata TaxID=231223 RepID=A0AAE1D323_9GAST|nr:hypothetical protein RRG08_003611 [Elysia crispata]
MVQTQFSVNWDARWHGNRWTKDPPDSTCRRGGTYLRSSGRDPGDANSRVPTAPVRLKGQVERPVERGASHPFAFMRIHTPQVVSGNGRFARAVSFKTRGWTQGVIPLGKNKSRRRRVGSPSEYRLPRRKSDHPRSLRGATQYGLEAPPPKGDARGRMQRRRLRLSFV